MGGFVSRTKRGNSWQEEEGLFRYYIDTRACPVANPKQIDGKNCVVLLRSSAHFQRTRDYLESLAQVSKIDHEDRKTEP